MIEKIIMVFGDKCCIIGHKFTISVTMDVSPFAWCLARAVLNKCVCDHSLPNVIMINVIYNVALCKMGLDAKLSILSGKNKYMSIAHVLVYCLATAKVRMSQRICAVCS